MDFNRLKTFLVVAETGNMTRAAERLFRTQSAITQQMKLLQEELGLVLFERRKARIFLTPHGKTLYEFARPRIRELEDLPAKLRNEKEAMQGLVRLEACSITGPLLYPFLASGFQKTYPNIRFQLKLVDPVGLEKHLLEGLSDFYLTLDRPENSILRYFPLNLCSCLPVRGSNFETGPLPSNEDPRKLAPWIGLANRHFDWEPWLQVFLGRDVGLHSLPPPVDTVGDVPTLHQLISAGLGIGMAFLPLAEKDLSANQLIPIFPGLNPVPIPVNLVYRSVRKLNLAQDLFLEFLQPDTLVDPSPKEAYATKTPT